MISENRPKKDWGAFEVVGIEIEYAVVHEKTLNVISCVDQLFSKITSQPIPPNQIEYADISWSNELANHVVELKMTKPFLFDHLDQAATCFQQHVAKINQHLKHFQAKLLPTAMHPWMNPKKETMLWPYGQHDIYQMYHKQFNCYQHGWSNLQSTHINLPFRGDKEFYSLHEAISLVLPLIPFISASSPFEEDLFHGHLDQRLWHYQQNQKGIPSIIGDLIPEHVKSLQEYQQKILDPIEVDLKRFHLDHVLEAQWVNSRAAILKKDLGAIEIRILDNQENPKMDFCLIILICYLIKDIDAFLKYENLVISPEWTQARKNIFLQSIRSLDSSEFLFSEDYLKRDGLILKKMGLWNGEEKSGLQLWRSFWDKKLKSKVPAVWHEGIETILEHGPLAERILKKSGKKPLRNDLYEIYQQLGDCLQQGNMFL
jgi:carboxylate-amine ligase